MKAELRYARLKTRCDRIFGQFGTWNCKMPERFVSLGLMLKAECLAPGQMGCLRNSMFTRETLIRAPLGRHFTRGRSLPPACFVYGKRPERDPDGMAKCLNWCAYKSVEDSKVYGVDYHKTNVESVKMRIHRVPEWVRFRKEKDFHRKPVKPIVQLKKPVFPLDMTFGKPTRPSTPIGCLLSHYYKREFDQMAIENNRSYLTGMAIAQNKSPQPYDTLKSANAVVRLPSKQPAQKLWTMKRFRSQPPRISSRWSHEEEQKMSKKMYEKPNCDVLLKK
ncbi:hypothetical protein ECG_06834 [Echinococcus granulosus]|uniref:Uncharacterized protein n=2 Tax=Echinococcus granulosus TaxID=6210 RepID=A0A068WG37_ECHGR|nr:hypothetical protein ECG_06834 [Echinococcus granulosus]CDS19073.1 hypothetical protein EgrG_000435300 [Echinococcus granulosus]